MIRRFSREQLVQALVLALVFLVPFLNLDQGSLKPWDEALTGERIREMAENHRYLTPHLYGEPDFNKPPLYYLISQPVWLLAGPGEFAVRFWSVVFASACALVAYFSLVSAGHRRSWGLLAALLLLLNPHWQNWTRMGLLDSGMALSILVGLRLLASPDLSNQRALWAGVVLGCGCLVKMPVVLVVVPISAVSSLILWRRLAWRQLLLALAVGAAFLLVWCGLQYALYGQAWLDFQKYNFCERFTANIEGQATSSMIYWDKLLEQVGFQFILLVSALVGAVWKGGRAFRRNLPELLFLLVWVFLILWTASKRSTYLLPAYPFAAVVTASLLGGLVPEAKRKPALVLVSCLALMNLALHFDYVPDHSPRMAAIGTLIRDEGQGSDFVDTTVKLERQVLAFYSHRRPDVLDPGRLSEWVERRRATPERGGYLVVEKGQVAAFERRLVTDLSADFTVERVAFNGQFAAFRLAPATADAPANLLYLEGWRAEEDWGRWIIAGSATSEAHGARMPARLVFEAASWIIGQPPVVCEFRVNGEMAGRAEIVTEPWQWQEYSVDIPLDSTGPLTIEWRFAQASAPDSRLSLPVRSVRIEAS